MPIFNSVTLVCQKDNGLFLYIVSIQKQLFEQFDFPSIVDNRRYPIFLIYKNCIYRQKIDATNDLDNV